MIKDNTKKIEDLKNEIERLQEQMNGFESLSPDKQLATKLHDTLCDRDHVEGCHWQYETEGLSGVSALWETPDHARWLTLADKLILTFGDKLSATEIMEFTTLLKSR